MARKSMSQNHGPDDKPGMRNNAFPSGPPAEEECKVGPGRPPKEHQFKPGQSGNPKGAKRKAPSLLPDLSTARADLTDVSNLLYAAFMAADRLHDETSKSRSWLMIRTVAG